MKPKKKTIKDATALLVYAQQVAHGINLEAVPTMPKVSVTAAVLALIEATPKKESKD